MIYDNVVIGSGTSALGCIVGLIKTKKKILCIDGSSVDLSAKNKKDNKKILFCKQNLPIRNFFFKRKSSKIFEPIEILENQSFGGLSTVWAANCLRLLKNDFDGWPISYDNLKKYYEVCEKIMSVDHFDDEISNELQIDKNNLNNDKLNLFSSFIKTFFKNKKHSSNFIAGFARIGIDPKCYKCGKCFFGCDDNYIFNTKNYLKKLVDEKQIEYKRDLKVKKFAIKEKIIELEIEGLENNKILTKKLFIGAGAFQTSKIVINSYNKKDQLNIKESQSFFVPCIYFGKNFSNDNEYQTLGQAQIVFKSNVKYKLGNIYYAIKYDQKLNDTILKGKFGLLSKLIPNFLKRRIFAIAGFVSSDHAIYTASIKKENAGFDVIENKDNKKKLKSEVLSQLKILENKFSFVSLKFLLKFVNFGRGFHMGGSLPMIDENKIKEIKKDDLYTKKNGEISDFKNVFIVDCANFPNIPAGSVSLTAMANALRIATESSND